MPVCGSIALRTLTGQSQACYLSHSKFEACSTDVSPRVTGDSYVAHRESTPPQHFFVTGNQSINRPALSGSIQPLVTPRDTEAFVGNRPQSSSVSNVLAAKTGTSHPILPSSHILLWEGTVRDGPSLGLSTTGGQHKATGFLLSCYFMTQKQAPTRRARV